MVAHPVRYSFREYIQLDETSNVKLEYAGGQIYAMAGGSPMHAALQAAVTSFLFAAVRGGPCRVFGADLRVRVAATGLTTYPDATVVCGAHDLDPDDAHTVRNPVVVVDVLSPSTEEYDRGEKREHFQQIASLRHHVLVAQNEPRVEVWTRDADRWTQRMARAGDVVELDAIRCSLDVSELYAAVAPPA